MVMQPKIQWRAAGAYLPINASKTGLLEETRQFLLAYARLHDITATREALVAGDLPQRSRATRDTIVKIIMQRLVRWHPPAWVWDDLIAFAQDEDLISLRAVVLLHVARQDTLLYDIVQQVIVPRWRGGERTIIRADVQRFLDEAQPAHPEIDRWSHETREKLAGNVLTILRDYGLLQGTVRKQIVEPVIPAPVVQHLARLLQEEGVTQHELPHHPDWQLWLWDGARAKAAIDASMVQEYAR